MKKLSEVYKEMRVAFTFPIEIRDEAGHVTYYETSDGYWHKFEYDSDGNGTYYENSDSYWRKSEYDSDGNETYYENSDGYWRKHEYDSTGNETYYENSRGSKRETPRASKTCEGKVVEVDGVKYQLKSL